MNSIPYDSLWARGLHFTPLPLMPGVVSRQQALKVAKAARPPASGARSSHSVAFGQVSGDLPGLSSGDVAPSFQLEPLVWLITFWYVPEQPGSLQHVKGHTDVIDAATGQLLDGFDVRPEVAPEEALTQSQRLQEWASKVVSRIDALQESVDEVQEAGAILNETAERVAQRVLKEAINHPPRRRT